ncbi:hypothetical protein RFI_28717, partial [Reticulomyxa filosa]
ASGGKLECRMCRNDLMGRCAECEESNANVESCAIAQGECNHVFHVHCLENTLKSHFRCPLCLQQLRVCCQLLSLHATKRFENNGNIFLNLLWKFKLNKEASKYVTKKKDESQMSVTVCLGVNGAYRSDDVIISKKATLKDFIEAVELQLNATTKDRRIMFQDKDIGFETKETLLSSLDLSDGSVVSICGMMSHSHSIQVTVKCDKKPFAKTVVIDMESKHTIRDVKHEIQQREEIISAKQQVFLNSDEQAKGNELKDKLSLVELAGYKHELKLTVTVRDKCMVTLDLFCKGHLLSGRDGGAVDGDVKMSQMLDAISWDGEDTLYVAPRNVYSLSTQVRSGKAAAQGPSSNSNSSGNEGSGYEDMFGLEPAWIHMCTKANQECRLY